MSECCYSGEYGEIFGEEEARAGGLGASCAAVCDPPERMVERLTAAGLTVRVDRQGPVWWTIAAERSDVDGTCVPYLQRSIRA